MQDFNFEPQFKEYALSLQFSGKFVKQMSRDELLSLIGFFYYTPPPPEPPEESEMPEIEEIELGEPETEKPKGRRRR